MNASANLKAVDGRVLKRKGATTRQRILDALEALLQETPISELRVAHLAVAAEVAMPTFYSYFESLEDALLALVEHEKFSYAKVLSLLQTPWPEGRIAEFARSFVTAYYDFWDEHRAVLRLRNVRGDEGDARFLAARLAYTLPIMDAISEKLAVAKGAGFLPATVPSSSFAAVILAALERNGSAFDPASRHKRADLIEASAQTLILWMTGRMAASPTASA
jgi:AcrR family transcriptional regulator